MTWTATPYCQRADIVLALDPNLTSTDFTFIDQLIPLAQADLDREIGYAFQQAGTANSPATRLYDGTGDNWLWIDDLVAVDTQSGAIIETYQNISLVNGVIWQLGSTTTIDITADCILKPNNYLALGVPAHKLVRKSGLWFQAGTQNYQVKGIFGEPIQAGQQYPGVPNDITRACTRLVIHYFKMRDTNYADTLAAQGVREKYTKSWPADVKAVVANYQHTRFLARS